MTLLSNVSYSHENCKKWVHINLWSDHSSKSPTKVMMAKIRRMGDKGWKLVQMFRLGNGSMEAFMVKCVK